MTIYVVGHRHNRHDITPVVSYETQREAEDCVRKLNSLTRAYKAIQAPTVLRDILAIDPSFREQPKPFYEDAPYGVSPLEFMEGP